MEEGSSNGWKTLWEKEKLLFTSNFSFSHIVFKRLVLQTRKNQGLFGKGLTGIVNCSSITELMTLALVIVDSYSLLNDPMILQPRRTKLVIILPEKDVIFVTSIFWFSKNVFSALKIECYADIFKLLSKWHNLNFCHNRKV